MHKLEKTYYGLKLTISGNISLDEVNLIHGDIKEVVNDINTIFSLIADLREMIPATQAVQKIINEIQTTCRIMGLVRAAVIVKSPVIRLQMLQATFISGNSNSDRYIDSSDNNNWEEQALKWVLNAEEPAIANQIHQNSSIR